MMETIPSENNFKHNTMYGQEAKVTRMLKRGPPLGDLELPEQQSGGMKRQKKAETWSGDAHLDPPGDASLGFSHHTSTEPTSSCVPGPSQKAIAGKTGEAVKPSQILKAALSPTRYNELRLTILKHQELFLGQLYDLHHTVQLQQHLVSICGRREAMVAELQKLEAEQRAHRNGISDMTVEQEEAAGHPEASALRQGSTAAQVWPCAGGAQPPQGGTPAISSKQAPEQQAGSASSRQQPPPSEPQQSNQVNPTKGGANMPGMLGSQPGVDLPQQGMWPGMFGQGYGPLQYGQPSMGMGAFNGWGMPMMGGFANPYGMPFGMMTPAMDPMMAWYAMHYGQYTHAMQNQANAANAAKAQRQAQAQHKGAAAAAENKTGKLEEDEARQNLRWWQDPEKVFGIAANPAVVANPPSAQPRQQANRKEELQAEVTSKPPEEQRAKKQAKVVKDEPKSMSNPTKTSSKAHGVASAGSEPIGSHQKAGSGLSAFKKLPTRSPNVRRPPTRAESIGSEVSRSAAERSPADEGESSGVDHAAAPAQ